MPQSEYSKEIADILEAMGFTNVKIRIEAKLWYFDSDQCRNVFIGQNKNQTIWLIKTETGSMQAILNKLAGYAQWRIDNVMCTLVI